MTLNILKCIVLLTVIVTVQSDDPIGHNQPIGSHRESDGHIDILQTFPTPKEFWDKYMSIGKPAVFRGAGLQFPALQKWTNEYLIKHYGDMEVKLEHKFEKKKTPIGSKGVGRDTIKTFLDTYLDESKYIVSQLPDPMAKEIMVLPFLTCGSFKERLLEANLWLSSGGSKSLLHKDADNAINCLINGTKDWMLIHPDYTPMLPVAEGDKGHGGFTKLNVEKVNLHKYPKFQQVHYNHANLIPGDCLFLPKSYWHQVNSFGQQNLAVSMLFSRLSAFNEEGCHDDLKYVPLSEAGLVWTYPGHGAQTLGNMDPYDLKEMMLDVFTSARKTKFRADDLKIFFEGQEEDEEEESGDTYDFAKEKEKLGKTLLRIFDVDKKGYLKFDDVKGSTIEQLKQAANAIDPDPANTDEYEHFLFKPNDVKIIIQKSIVNQVLKKSLLIKNYKSLGGSENIGNQLFDILSAGYKSSGSEEDIPKDVVVSNIQDVLELYEKKRTADKTESVDDGYSDDGDSDEDKDDEDLNEDGYPDHDPIYQPEDEHMRKESKGGDDYSRDDVEKPDDVEDIDDERHVDNHEDANDVLDGDAADENGDGYPDHEPVYQPFEDDIEKEDNEDGHKTDDNSTKDEL